MEREVVVSLCIPTNGVKEWVNPVLESIYSQGISNDLFEVIVTCNGNSSDFDSFMSKQSSLHKNLLYKKTTSQGFYNQVDSFKLANGKFIKFLNHRMIMKPGSIDRLIKYAQKNDSNKPITFFTNGSIVSNSDIEFVNDFDTFINKLSIYSSWSGGFSCWKEDFDSLIDQVEIDTLFPHCPFLFGIRKGRTYCVDNSIMLEEVENDETKKGDYDLFYAFSVDYLSLMLRLYMNKDISYSTFNKIKDDVAVFVHGLYKTYCVNKRACSYNLNSFDNSISIFYSSQRNFRLIVLRKKVNSVLARIKKS